MEQIKKENILCIDQGTTSTRVCVINKQLNILWLEQVEHEQIHQNPGWTEHDPMQIYYNIKLLIEKLYHKDKEVLNFNFR
jgi:glycerol kinase